MKHIIKRIWIERRANLWIMLELVGMFTCLLTVTDYFLVRLKNYSEPLGANIENTYTLKLKTLSDRAGAYVDPSTISESRSEELRTLAGIVRMYPDVENVSLSLYALPYANGGFYDGIMLDTIADKQNRLSCQIRWVTTDYLDVFRVMSYDMQPIRATGQNMGRQLVLSEKTAVEMFGSAQAAIGKTVYGGGGYSPGQPPPEAKIVGVSTNFKAQEFNNYENCAFEIHTPTTLDLSIPERVDFCVRVKEGRSKHFEENFIADMGEQLKINNLYISSVIPFKDIRNDVIGKKLREEIRLMLYITIFALITVSLGIFGTFWLRGRQRFSETGIRMAMGASKQAVRKEMIVESMLLMALAAVPAFSIYINLLYTDVLDTYRLAFTTGRVSLVAVFTLLVMSFIILSSTIIPANHAASIQPVDALKNE